MRALQEGEDWGFSPVIKLVYTLSAGIAFEEVSPNTRDETTGLPRIVAKATELPGTVSIESQKERESRLGNFDQLWTFLGQDLDLPPPIVKDVSKFDELRTGNGYNSNDSGSGKPVRWQDEIEGADLEDNDLSDEANRITEHHSSTKTRKRRETRKRRKEERKAKSGHALESLPAGKSNGNGSDGLADRVSKQSEIRRALLQQIINDTSLKNTTTPASGKAARSIFATQCKKHGITMGQSPSLLTGTQSAPVVTSAPSLISSSDQNMAIAAERKAKLISKLYEEFIDERQFLKNTSLLQHTPNGTENTPDGIHVFVDISNILIGFHDALKMSRGLSIQSRIRRQTLSFHNLSLILERGRPAAKRVVAGSDNLDSVREAALLGYETNILDRVHKAKPLTAYQKRQHLSAGQSSGSETPAPLAREKWVEQAVDEILHLKILESVVDARQPATIVLATGDAAEAEYSGGFLKMVERALAKGWRVELVSFRHNTSGAYRKREFRARWGEAFKTVELDEFAELLLGGGAGAVV
ncbi:hypothetical protein MMC13_000233 [Lambiella insularis]|nr:hypothetical protein [Lambiella insularis]